MENYILVYSHDKEAFRKKVNSFIEIGYIPIGGICIDKDGYYQAMIKKEKM